MAGDKLPDQYRPATPAPRTSGVPARRVAPPAAPVHSARTLGFSESPGREYWWRLLDDSLKARIAEKVGPAIEWWAYHHDLDHDRPYAVVFGPRGLAVTSPTVSDTGRPAHLLQVRRFVPGSVRHAIVRQQPNLTWGSAGGPARTGGAAAAGAAPVAASSVTLPLSEFTRGFLGNLPAEAQARLQQPFLSTDPVQDSDFFYHGTDEELDVWCYLAGSRTVAFASGRRVAPAGAPPQAASWQLICRQAEVLRR